METSINATTPPPVPTSTREQYEIQRDAIYMAYEATRSGLVREMLAAQLPTHLIAEAVETMRDEYRRQLAADPILQAYHAAHTRI
jgi:hypothetical protein